MDTGIHRWEILFPSENYSDHIHIHSWWHWLKRIKQGHAKTDMIAIVDSLAGLEELGLYHNTCP